MGDSQETFNKLHYLPHATCLTCEHVTIRQGLGFALKIPLRLKPCTTVSQLKCYVCGHFKLIKLGTGLL
jgi:hypothetical protein